MFNGPVGLCHTDKGYLVVCDVHNNRIQVKILSVLWHCWGGILVLVFHTCNSKKCISPSSICNMYANEGYKFMLIFG